MTHRPLPSTVARRRARLLTAAAALILAVAAPRLYAQVRIGVVDIRRAVTETNEGRVASDQIKARYDQRQTDLNARTREIETLKRRIERPSAPIPQPRLQKMAQQYQQKVLALQQLGQQYTTELQQMEAELTKNILTKMQPIVREVGQSDNFQIIVDEQVVHFAPTHLNLTDRVIQLYNQRYPAAAPQPAAGRTGAGTTPTTQASSGQTGAGTSTARPTTTQQTQTPPQQTQTGAATGSDTGRRPLPGVFYRRDAGR